MQAFCGLFSVFPFSYYIIFLPVFLVFQWVWGCGVKPIYQHAHEPFTVGQLAKELGVSREYLSRTFKSVEGISLSEFIRNSRIKAAQKLLRYSERSVLEISRYLGFSSQSHFSAVFRSQTGRTPQEYRRDFSEK